MVLNSVLYLVKIICFTAAGRTVCLYIGFHRRIFFVPLASSENQSSPFLLWPSTITKTFLWFFCFAMYYYGFLLFSLERGRHGLSQGQVKYFRASLIPSWKGWMKELSRGADVVFGGLCRGKCGWSVFYAVVCRPAYRDWWLIIGHYASPAADHIFTLNMVPGLNAQIQAITRQDCSESVEAKLRFDFDLCSDLTDCHPSASAFHLSLIVAMIRRKEPKTADIL